MFLVFRIVIFLLSLVVAILSAFALAGSYEKASYLTPAYLIDFHVKNINLSLLFAIDTPDSKKGTNKLESKRENFIVEEEEKKPTKLYNLVDLNGRDTATTTYGNSYLSSFISVKAEANGDVSSITYAVYGTNVQTYSLVTSVYTVRVNNPAINAGNDPFTTYSVATSVFTTSTMYAVATSTYTVGYIASGTNTVSTSTGATNTVSGTSATSVSPTAGAVKQAMRQILSQPAVNYAALGFADVYSISFWGYCRGIITGDVSKTAFENNKVQWIWCSKSQAGYSFSPIKVIKHEMLNSLNGQVDGEVAHSDTVFLSQQDQTTKDSAIEVINGLTYDNINLPGNLESNIKRLNGLNKAAFGLLLLTCLCGCISALVQLLGMFLSPESFLLSLLNYAFQCLIFVFALVSAAMVTAVYVFVRSQVNDNTSVWGVKSFLSINFYAYVWAVVAASLLIVVFSFLGHCLGLFGTGRKRYRRVRTEKAVEEAVEKAIERAEA
ncbi:uncharacterized protein KQ657_000280 [Scheffersomyces spartinae]|uniref:Uncharacterized protein n=1 Tax=Scheffersomyces spartinae TaxID=45513 RepID=A0A9P7VEB6_9ASCO|nr:uncharacterized protein KQ657_000280 [Scheffersomyces spartinae]KAG7196265.1 hypothetical protein KQ657_000280 [Scheffersomyces spartinae]